MTGRLDGRVAIVTGAASGFGRATAIGFAREGAKVIVADLDEEHGNEVLREVEQLGGEAELVVGDVSATGTATGLAQCANERWGRLDILVNNAGIAQERDGFTWNMAEDAWDRVIEVNLRSVYVCSKAVVPSMLEAGTGSIVNVASIAVASAVGGAAYAASKGGVLSYTRAVAAELGPYGVRVNCVSPGFMRTPMSTGERDGATPEMIEARMRSFGSWVPMGRAGGADDIAAAILFLAGDEAAYVTGQEIVVDGGWRIRGPVIRSRSS